MASHLHPSLLPQVTVAEAVLLLLQDAVWVIQALHLVRRLSVGLIVMGTDMGRGRGRDRDRGRGRDRGMDRGTNRSRKRVAMNRERTKNPRRSEERARARQEQEQEQEQGLESAQQVVIVVAEGEIRGRVLPLSLQLRPPCLEG
jgi:hypothetical protein